MWQQRRHPRSTFPTQPGERERPWRRTGKTEGGTLLRHPSGSYLRGEPEPEGSEVLILGVPREREHLMGSTPQDNVDVLCLTVSDWRVVSLAGPGLSYEAPPVLPSPSGVCRAGTLIDSRFGIQKADVPRDGEWGGRCHRCIPSKTLKVPGKQSQQILK